MNKSIGSFKTGSFRKYTPVCLIGVECELDFGAILSESHKNSNSYKACKFLVGQGARKITYASYQFYGSSQYSYKIYYGYEKNK